MLLFFTSLFAESKKDIVSVRYESKRIISVFIMTGGSNQIPTSTRYVNDYPEVKVQ